MANATFKSGNYTAADYTPSSAVSAGDVIVTTDTVRIAHRDIDVGVLGALATRGGIYEGTKATGTAWTDGQTLYWDATASDIKTTANTGINKKIGVAAGAATAADTTGLFEHAPE